jgi:type IV secretion system protein VirB3
MWGLPLPLALVLFVAGAEVQVWFKGLTGVAWALALVAPVWIAARFLVARDYNAVGVAALWCNTSARGFDSADWGGASVAPLPVGSARGPRGMSNA